MGFEEFRKELSEGLKRIYGDSAEITPATLHGNNGKKRRGIQADVKGGKTNAVPVISLEGLHAAYGTGDISMEDCIRAAHMKIRDGELPAEAARLADMALDWEAAKENVYPILLSAAENRELLSHLASQEVLDLAVAYIIRLEMPGCAAASIKVSRDMLKNYGISQPELHRQALENLGHDGYRFEDMEAHVDRILNERGHAEEPQPREGLMFILTNRAGLYGAAGILDGKLLRGFSRGRSFFILPSSIHEVLFVPASDLYCREELDSMVREVNRSCVAREERLADHSYYYDAESGEIRICA